MVERDKNHPCVIMWSLGNESGVRANLRRWPPGRARATRRGRSTTRATRRSDVYSRMYPSHEEIEAIGRDGARPSCCASTGTRWVTGLVDWPTTRRCSSATRAARAVSSGSGSTTLCGARRSFAYGGDFGEHARRQLLRRRAGVPRPAPSPGLLELKKVFEPMRITGAGGRMRVETAHVPRPGIPAFRRRIEVGGRGVASGDCGRSLPAAAVADSSCRSCRRGRASRGSRSGARRRHEVARGRIAVLRPKADGSRRAKRPRSGRPAGGSAISGWTYGAHRTTTTNPRSATCRARTDWTGCGAGAVSFPTRGAHRATASQPPAPTRRADSVTSTAMDGGLALWVKIVPDRRWDFPLPRLSAPSVVAAPTASNDSPRPSEAYPDNGSPPGSAPSADRRRRC